MTYQQDLYTSMRRAENLIGAEKLRHWVASATEAYGREPLQQPPHDKQMYVDFLSAYIELRLINVEGEAERRQLTLFDSIDNEPCEFTADIDLFEGLDARAIQIKDLGQPVAHVYGKPVYRKELHGQ